MTSRAVARTRESPRQDQRTPLSRRERRKLELHARILETAGQLFADRGFQQTRVAEICDRVDIAHKTFFNHFPTKLHLLREMAQAGIERLFSEIEAIRRADLSTRERLHRVFDTVAEHVTEAGPRNRELVTELVHAISGDPSVLSDQARWLHAAFAGIVEAGVEQGDVTRRHGAESLTQLILGTYYVLNFDYANLDGFPIRARAHTAAHVLADALAPHPEETDGTT